MVLEENGEDKMARKVNNEVIGRIEKNRTLLKNILRRKVNWISHILRRNCLLRDVIQGHKTEVKGVRRRTQLLDNLRNKRYWELKGKVKDPKRWKRQFFHMNIRKKYKLSSIRPWTR